MSIFLGDQLCHISNQLADGHDTAHSINDSEINLRLSNVPIIKRDNTDRNRTSPLAFVGNRFEFRAQGSSGNISMALTCLNATVATALKSMNDKVRQRFGDKPTDVQALEVIKETLKTHKQVLFNGNNYSAEWHKEAEKRGLPNLKNTVEALAVLKDPATIKVMGDLGILNETEVRSRYNVQLERYIKVRLIELETLQELVATHIYPGAMLQLEQYARAAGAVQSTLGTAPQPLIDDMKKLTSLTTSLATGRAHLDRFITECQQSHDHEQVAHRLANEGMELMASLRHFSNELELMIDDHLWSLPKYREMLYYF
jgi:glutamine synthetase